MWKVQLITPTTRKKENSKDLYTERHQLQVTNPNKHGKIREG